MDINIEALNELILLTNRMVSDMGEVTYLNSRLLQEIDVDTVLHSFLEGQSIRDNVDLNQHLLNELCYKAEKMNSVLMAFYKSIIG